MSEVFNHRNSLTGKIPSGLFNSCFDLESSSWADDASATKCLAFDGYFISLLDLRLDCRPLALADHVVRDVPAAWDPSAIARYGRLQFSLLSCCRAHIDHNSVFSHDVTITTLTLALVFYSSFRHWQATYPLKNLT
jgi:hypothetical protein